MKEGEGVVIKTLGRKTQPSVLIGALNECSLVNLPPSALDDGYVLPNEIKTYFLSAFLCFFAPCGSLWS